MLRTPLCPYCFGMNGNPSATPHHAGNCKNKHNNLCFYCFKMGGNPSAKPHCTGNCTNPHNTHGPNFQKTKQVVVVQTKPKAMAMPMSMAMGMPMAMPMAMAMPKVKSMALSQPAFVRAVSVHPKSVQRYDDSSSLFRGAEVRPDTAMKFCRSCNQRTLFVADMFGSMCCRSCN